VIVAEFTSSVSWHLGVLAFIYLEYVKMQKFCFVISVLITIFNLSALAEEPSKPAPHQNVGGILDAKDSGTISGLVYFTGKKPEQKPIADIEGNAYCSSRHKDKTPVRDTFVFGKHGDKETLQNVLVYVSKGLEDKEFDPSKTPVLLDQVGCMYSPHVVAVMVGQTLTIRNSDDTLHNVMCSPRVNPQFNFAMPVKDGTNDIVFKGAEMKMNTKCFMHPWMSAYVHVLPHPFFAVTEEDGSFTIKGLPPGDYEITVLHEASLLAPTPATANVTVGSGETKNLEFTYQIKPSE
jgi:hypothetical protein